MVWNAQLSFSLRSHCGAAEFGTFAEFGTLADSRWLFFFRRFSVEGGDLRTCE
ncbi:hypothetical protein FORC37_3066 [Vibrio vulnificus]|nr:hypothetical protein FORC37_3066 [Vibrio vulnificus]